jgi:hypothetical protein
MDASAKLLKKSMNLGLKVAIELGAAARGRTGLADAVPDGGRKPLHGAGQVESVPVQATDPRNQVQ